MLDAKVLNEAVSKYEKDMGFKEREGWQVKLYKKDTFGNEIWRKVVASPVPKDIVEIDAVEALLNAGIIPITVGGGGIPVIEVAPKVEGDKEVYDCNYSVSFTRPSKAGQKPMAGVIPGFRLDPKVLKSDLAFLSTLGDINFKYGSTVKNAADLAKKYDAVIVAAGQDTPVQMGIENEKLAVSWVDYLENPKKVNVKGKAVAIVGGGAVAADCAETAAANGAEAVEMFCLETLGEMPLTANELNGLMLPSVNWRQLMPLYAAGGVLSAVLGIKDVAVFYLSNGVIPRAGFAHASALFTVSGVKPFSPSISSSCRGSSSIAAASCAMSPRIVMTVWRQRAQTFFASLK